MILTLSLFAARSESFSKDTLDTNFPGRANRIVRSLAKTIAEDHIRSPASSTYHLVLFAVEGEENYPKDSHSFASFVYVDEQDQQHWATISWLPETFADEGEVCAFDDIGDAIGDTIWGSPCDPVVGKNYSVRESIDFALERGKKLAIWRPIFIPPELHTFAKQRIKYLNSGVVKYVADDRNTRKREEAINCIHAIGDMDESRMSYGGFLGSGYKVWGIKGTRHIWKHFYKWDWILESYNDGFPEETLDGYRLN